MQVSNSIDVITTSFQGVWLDFFSAIPWILAAIVVFALGWAIAIAIGKIVAGVVVSLKLDEGLGKLGLREGLERAGLRLDSAAFLGGLFRWVFVVVFLLAAANILQLEGVTLFLKEVLLYIPNLIIAAIMVIATLLLAGFFEKLVHASVEAARLKSGAVLGSLAKWATLLFGFLAAVQQLGVAKDIINIFVTGFVAMVALAGGIAFGVAGKDFASDALKRLAGGAAEKNNGAPQKK